MGLFGPFIYQKKKGVKYFLHFRDRGKSKIYFFSKDPTNALNGIPKGYEAAQNSMTGMPFLRKKGGGKENKKEAKKP